MKTRPSVLHVCTRYLNAVLRAVAVSVAVTTTA